VQNLHRSFPLVHVRYDEYKTEMRNVTVLALYIIILFIIFTMWTLSHEAINSLPGVLLTIKRFDVNTGTHAKLTKKFTRDIHFQVATCREESFHFSSQVANESHEKCLLGCSNPGHMFQSTSWYTQWSKLHVHRGVLLMYELSMQGRCLTMPPAHEILGRKQGSIKRLRPNYIATLWGFF
jgi:hypothetical protein